MLKIDEIGDRLLNGVAAMKRHEEGGALPCDPGHLRDLAEVLEMSQVGHDLPTTPSALREMADGIEARAQPPEDA